MNVYKDKNTSEFRIGSISEEIREVFNKLRENISIIENKIFEIQKLEEELKVLEEQNKELKNTKEKLINEKEKLEKDVNDLIEIIEKEKWKQWSKSYSNIDKLNEINFHLFLCYRNIYATKKSPIDYHKEILDCEGKYKPYLKNKEKFVWWGKFRKDEKGMDLEPIGEAWGQSYIAKKFVNIINNRLQKNDIIYLFLYDPNPPVKELYVALLERVEYTEGDLPSFKTIPSCAFIPDYYFKEEKNPERCLFCDRKMNFCELKYTCNFWFKIKKIKKLPLQEFNNIINFATDDTINFAIPIMYPLVVYLKEEKEYFSEEVKEELVTPIEPIPEFEKGHVKEKEVRLFCEKLQRKCNFIKDIRQIDITYEDRKIGICNINATSKTNELKFILPEKYHRKNAKIVLLIILDENTTEEQKVKYWEQIKEIQDEIL